MNTTPANLALFDLDHTLLAIDSDEAWVGFLIDRGALDRAVVEAANRELVARYQRGEADALAFTQFYLATLVPHAPATLDGWHPQYLRERIVPAIRREARALVAAHRDAGDLVVMTTATSRFLTAPIARELGFEHLIATEPEMLEGRYTGRVAGTPNMREGKIARLVEWLAARGERLDSFARTYFYSDSRNDIPLLSQVSDPVAVNPDDELEALARAKGWPILRLA
jgi:HAD superfamily hydrolase (TIGR01490 family)